MGDQHTETPTEAWKIRELEEHLGDANVVNFYLVAVPIADGVTQDLYFDTAEEAEAFVQTPIRLWREERATELLRRASTCLHDAGYLWGDIREFLAGIEGGDRG